MHRVIYFLLICSIMLFFMTSCSSSSNNVPLLTATPKPTLQTSPNTTPLPDIVINPLNAIYTIDDKEYLLVKGYTEELLSSKSNKKRITELVRTIPPMRGDLNNDKLDDYTIILRQHTDGNEPSYYIAALINNPAYKANLIHQGTNAVLLGDKFTFKSMTMDNGKITLEYFAHHIDDAKINKTKSATKKIFILKDGQLIE